MKSPPASAILVSLLTSFTPAGPPPFQVQHPVGRAARAVAVGDFTGDRVPEIAAACSDPSDPHVALLVGTGEGRFAAPYAAIRWGEPFDIAAGDLDGDGRADLAVTSGRASFSPTSAPKAVRIFFGDPKGEFSRSTDPIDLPGSGDPGSAPSDPMVLIADATGDGRPEAIVAALRWQHPTAILTLIGGGSRALTGKASEIPDRGNLYAIACGDLNEDGKTDLVLARSGMGNGILQIALGNGDGTFAEGPEVIAPGGNAPPEGMAAADLDADGHLDIVCSLYGSRRLAIHYGKGKGRFETPALLESPGFPRWLGVGDYDGDRELDLYACSIGVTPNAGSLYAGLGGRAYALPGHYALDCEFLDGASADVNGDGIEDLVTVSAKDRVTVALGGMPYGLAGERHARCEVNPRALVVADANEDGRDDLIAVASGPASLLVLTSRADGSLRAEEPIPIPRADSDPFCAAVADMDAEGHPDIVVGDWLGEVHVFFGDGGGSFSYRKSAPVPVGRNGPGAIAVGDLDADAYPDAVVVSYGSDKAYVIRGDGTGGFEGPRSFGVSVTSGFLSGQVCLADLDRDGRLDCLLATTGTRAVAVLPGDGAGGFGAQRVLPALPLGRPSAGGDLAAGDVDADGIPDVIALDASAERFVVWRGRGGFSFGDPVEFAAGDLPRGLRIADVDLDGDLDLLCGAADSDPGGGGRSASVLLRNDGYGGFPSGDAFLLARYPQRIAVADLDGNGAPELIAEATEVEVLLNASKPAAVRVTRVEPPAGPRSGGTPVAIRGSGFAPGMRVTFGGIPAPAARCLSATTIEALTPPAAGEGYVPVGVGSFSLPNAFRYRDARRIASVTPAWAPLSGGAQVRIAVEGLAPPVSRVALGKHRARVLSVDASSVLVETPAVGPGDAGLADVAVTDGAGRLELPGGFYFGRRTQPGVANVRFTRDASGGGTLQWDNLGSYDAITVRGPDGETYTIAGDSTSLYFDASSLAGGGSFTIYVEGDDEAGIDGSETQADLPPIEPCGGDLWAGPSTGRPGDATRKIGPGEEYGGLIHVPSSTSRGPVDRLIFRALATLTSAPSANARLWLRIRSGFFTTGEDGTPEHRILRDQEIALPRTVGRPEWISTRVWVNPAGLEPWEPGYGQERLDLGEALGGRDLYFTLALEAPEGEDAAVLLHFDDQPAFWNYFLYEDGDRWTREQYLRCSECEGCSVEELGRILGVYSPCILLRVTALGAQEPPVAIRTLTYAETGLGDMPRPFLPGSPPPEPRRTFSFSVELKPESAPVTQYRWDFGDGARAITAGNSVSHSYSSDGEYRVLVTAVGANCDEGSALSRGLFLRIDEPGAPPERLEASRVYNEFGVERPNVFVGHEATRAQLEIGPDGSPRGRVVPHTVAFYTYVWPGAEGLHPEHPVTFWVQYPEGGEAIEFPAEPADGDRSEALWRECLWRAEIDFSRIQPKPGASRDGAPLRVFYTVFPAGGTDPLMVSRGTEVEAWDLPLPWRSDFALGDYVTAKLSFEPKRRAYRLEGKFPNGRNGVADLSSPIVLGDLCLWDGACLAEDVRIENRARAALSSALFFTLDDARYDRFPAELAGELLVQFLDRKLVDESFPVRSIGCLRAQDAGKLCFRLCKPAIFSGSRTIFEYTVPIFDAWIVTVTFGARLRMDYGIDGGIEVAFDPYNEFLPSARLGLCPHIDPNFEMWLDADLAFIVGAGVSAEIATGLGLPIQLAFDPLASPPLDLDAELCWRFKVLLHFYGKICGFRFFDIADVTLLDRRSGEEICAWCWIDPESCSPSAEPSGGGGELAAGRGAQASEPEQADPAVCSGPAGSIAVWVQDTDPSPVRVVPELYWSLRAGEGDWPAGAPVFPFRGRMPSDPSVAWVAPGDGQSPGQAVLVWAENRLSLAEFEAQYLADGAISPQEFSNFQRAQDIYLAVWEASLGWSAPIRVSDLGGELFADAFPEVAAFGDGRKAVLAWCRVGGSLAPGGAGIATCTVDLAGVRQGNPSLFFQYLADADGALDHQVKLTSFACPGEGYSAACSWIKDSDGDLATSDDREVEIWVRRASAGAFVRFQHVRAVGALEQALAVACTAEGYSADLFVSGPPCASLATGAIRHLTVTAGAVSDLGHVQVGSVYDPTGEIFQEAFHGAGRPGEGPHGMPVDGRGLDVSRGPGGEIYLGFTLRGVGDHRDADGEFAVATLPAGGNLARVDLLSQDRLAQDSMAMDSMAGQAAGVEVVGIERRLDLSGAGGGAAGEIGLSFRRLSARPDLRVDLEVVPPVAMPGQEVLVRARVSNAGGAPAEAAGLELLLERDVGTDEPWDLWEPLHGEELPSALAPGAGAGFEFPLILREGADRLRLSAGAAPGETHLKDNSAERTIGLWKPTGLACSQDPSGGPDAVLSWDPLAPGIEVAIARDGRPVAIAAGSAGSFVETGVPPGSHTWTLTAQLEGMRSLPAACTSGVAEYRCLFSVAPATLRLGDAQGATTHLLADLIPDFALRGFSAGIAHDRERLVLTAADFAGTAFEGAPFQEVDFVEGGVNATAILAADPASWPEGAGVKLLRLAYRARPWTEARDGETAILLRSDLGAGRVPVAFQAPSGAWEDAATRAGRIEILAAAGPRFRRGDANSDGRIDVSDAVATLGYLFLGSEKPGCLRACDADADGRLAITDPIRLLNYLFLGGDAPAPPFPGCGLDPSPEAPSCDAYPEDLCR